MQLSSVLEIAVMGTGVFFTFWLTLRVGRALLNRLGIRTSLKPEPFFVMASQADHENPVFQPVPDGQERLATQPERDDINEKIERAHSTSTVRNTPM